MKKWLGLGVLSVFGALVVYDLQNNVEWLRAISKFLYDLGLPTTWTNWHSVFVFVLVVIMLISYNLLRIRSKSSIFTFVCALYMPVFIFAMTHFDRFVIDVIEGEIGLFDYPTFNVVVTLLIISVISGITMSEAKSKKVYLTSEFIYLLSILVLVINLAAGSSWLVL